MMLQSTLKWRQREIHIAGVLLHLGSLVPRNPPTPLSSHLRMPHSALPSQLTFVTQWSLPTAPLKPLDNGVDLSHS